MNNMYDFTLNTQAQQNQKIKYDKETQITISKDLYN